MTLKVNPKETPEKHQKGTKSQTVLSMKMGRTDGTEIRPDWSHEVIFNPFNTGALVPVFTFFKLQ